MSDSSIIWQFTDQKPGHENQSKGLIRAISQKVTVDSHRIIVPSSLFKLLLALLTGSFYRQISKLPSPTYLVATGRRTHLPMLLAHIWFGGKRIVLMRSFWPNCWFEHMLIPAHDNPKNNVNILATQGAINNIPPSDKQDSSTGIILIGGPSKHYHWDSHKVILQISEIINSTPAISWQLANSRRTPTNFFEQLGSLLSHAPMVDYKAVDSHWLPTQLESAGQVWVSPDSVSMVYESLTSGALVGSLTLDEKQQNNRIVNGINMLIKKKMLTSFEQWQTDHTLASPSHPLDEAQRAADWILNQ